MSKKEDFKRDLFALMDKYNMIIYSKFEGDSMGIYDESIEFVEVDKSGYQKEVLLSVDGCHASLYEIKMQEV